jgi:hypothetical protein
MTNIMNYDLLGVPINCVHNAIISNPDSIELFAAFQLYGSRWKRLLSQSFDLFDYPRDCCFGSERRSFATDGFGTTLYDDFI